LAQHARDVGLLQPLTEQRVRGANWAWLLHRDSEHNPLARHFCQWLQSALSAGA
ncbi:LysR family transcriptional regulator, partial [Serratia marcescens subsp. marcescens ATCC 13880]